MIADGVNICEKYGAVLMEKTILPSNVVTYDEWLENAVLPVNLREDRYEYASITVKLFVEGEGDNGALIKISDIVKCCTRCELGFSDLEFSYPGAVLTTTSQKKVMAGAYEFTMKFQAAAKQDAQVTVSGQGSVTTENPGNRKGPCTVAVTPELSLGSLTVTGVTEKPIILRNLQANATVVIDGEAGTVKQEGTNKFSDYEAWEFPRILPGENVISVSNEAVTVQVSYRPMYI